MLQWIAYINCGSLELRCLAHFCRVIVDITQSCTISCRWVTLLLLSLSWQAHMTASKHRKYSVRNYMLCKLFFCCLADAYCFLDSSGAYLQFRQEYTTELGKMSRPCNCFAVLRRVRNCWCYYYYYHYYYYMQYVSTIFLSLMMIAFCIGLACCDSICVWLMAQEVVHDWCTTDRLTCDVGVSW